MAPTGQPVRYADRLRVVLEAFNAREEQGAPGVIRVFRGIHQASWALLDGDTRLLMHVVFDGDLHGYLRALARDVPAMLHLVWSNCEGWPEHYEDPDEFIHYIEKFQQRVGFFYAHNPQLTVPDIERLQRLRSAVDELADTSADVRELQARLYREDAPSSGELRRAAALTKYGDSERLKEGFWRLFAPLYTEVEVEHAARESFGGEPTSRLVLPLTASDDAQRSSELQQLLLTPYPDAHAARLVFVHFPTREAGQNWLRTVRSHISCGAAREEPTHLSMGFTYEGLQALGVDATVLTEFPTAFAEGMAARADLLGDNPGATRTDARKHWTAYHGDTAPIHAVLFVHAETSSQELQAALLDAGSSAQARAQDLRGERDPRTRGDASGELQRFEDSLSAALDEAHARLHLGNSGVRYLGHQDLHRPLVQPPDPTAEPYGVEYFGFRDGLSQPQLPAADGRGAFDAHWQSDPPSFDVVLRPEPHGLLKNASFLVVRQLRQDPELFWEHMAERADELGISKVELGEQIVGRRLDGRRLDSRSESYDPARDRHAFDPDRETPSCPFHSHVRRMNPRTELDRRRNPRLLRRSLSYTNQRGGRYEQGLMFLAFNADIEGQFELIQRHWVQGGNHAGLAAEDRDVLASAAHQSTPHAPRVPARFYAERQARELSFDDGFIELEWGIYLYFPAREALQQL
jgi:Dyp-type peroxidase family